MFLITKVNVPIELLLFQGILKPLQARRMKKIYRDCQLSKNVGHYCCLTKKNCLLKLSVLARNTLNIWRARQCKFTLWFVFTINCFFLRNCLKLTSAFEFSSSVRYLRYLEFRFGFYFFNHKSWCPDNFRYFQGKSKVDFSLEIIMPFSLKSNWIEIHVAFHFLTVQSLLFENSFDHDVTPNMTYLLLLLEIQNFYAQS